MISTGRVIFGFQGAAGCEIDGPDCVALSKAYGGDGVRVEKAGELPAAIDAALAQYGVASPDELAPGPPRKAYDSYARPRDGEPTDDDVISKKAPLIAQQVDVSHALP